MKVLACVDGSEESYDALRFAIDEAKERGYSLKILHSIRSEKEDEEGKLLLKRAKEMAEDSGIKAETHLIVREKHPADDIVWFAEEERVDHIILGGCGVSGVKKLMIGSVCEGVVKRAHCPVTVVKTHYKFE